MVVDHDSSFLSFVCLWLIFTANIQYMRETKLRILRLGGPSIYTLIFSVIFHSL